MKLVFPLILLALATCAGAVETSGAFRLEYSYVEHGETTIAHGTAFAISAQTLLTAAHNILDRGRIADHIRIETEDGWTDATVVKYDNNLDLAKLEITKPVAHLDIATEDVKRDAAVTMLASLKGEKVAPFEGLVLRRFYEATVRTMVEIVFKQGCSGSPLLNKEGKVVGVAVCGIPRKDDNSKMDEGLGCFMPVSAIKAFLEDK